MFKKKPALDANEVSSEIVLSSIQKILKQSRRTDAWFKVLVIGYVLTVSMMIFKGDASSVVGKTEAHVAIVPIHGEISSDQNSALTVTKELRSAFENEHSQFVLLDMNSPGGSPTQSDIIYEEVNRLKQLHDKPVYAVVGDLCASGCYYISSAADLIYINKASMVGSIGVKMGSFNFHRLIETYGVSRMDVTAGEHKLLMDPFQPVNADAMKHLETYVIGPTYERFKEVVIQGRGDRIDPQNSELFSGLIWTGPEAVSRGLADGYGDVWTVSREYFNGEITDDNLIWYQQPVSGLKALFAHAASALSKEVSAMKFATLN
jgi:protease-4